MNCRTRLRWTALVRSCCILTCLSFLSNCVPSTPPTPPKVIRAGKEKAPLLLAASYVTTLGTRGQGPLQFEEPRGLALSPQGFLIVADTGNHRIQVLPPNLRSAETHGGEGWRAGEFRLPVDVMVRDTKLYVVDSANDRIQACMLGHWLFRVVAGGEGSPSLDRPQGISVDTTGAMHITDMRHRWVRVAPDGELDEVRGGFGGGELQFRYPEGIRHGLARTVYIADTQNHRIQQFDFSGNLLRVWGKQGSQPGEFESPSALALDRWGRVFVVDPGNRRVQVFTPSGEFLIQVAHSTLRQPSGIAASLDGVLYVSDATSNDIKQFQLISRRSLSQVGESSP